MEDWPWIRDWRGDRPVRARDGRPERRGAALASRRRVDYQHHRHPYESYGADGQTARLGVPGALHLHGAIRARAAADGIRVVGLRRWNTHHTGSRFGPQAIRRISRLYTSYAFEWGCTSKSHSTRGSAVAKPWQSFIPQARRFVAFGVLSEASDLASDTPPPTRPPDFSSMRINIHTEGM
jgi:hypothetical protein